MTAASQTKAAVSEKKRLANRNNASKSKGPKTKEGKAKVALNAVKHGLRSNLIVLPGEDSAGFDAMLGAWMDDWKPPTDARRVLVEQAVAHAWRMRRCLKLERDHLADRGHAAVKGHRAAAAARVRKAVAVLAGDPAAAVRALRGELEGVEALVGLWSELAGAAASADTWCSFALHHDRMLALLGLGRESDSEEIGGAVLDSWRLMVRNNDGMDEHAGDLPGDDDEAESLAASVAAFVAAQLVELRTYRSRFTPAEAFEARVAMGAALDDSAEGRALLRYEGQHGRAFRATLNQLIKLTQTGVDLVDDDEPEPEGSPVGSAIADRDSAPERSAIADPTGADCKPQVIAVETVKPDEAAAPNKATEAVPGAPNKATEPAPPAPNKATGAITTAPDRVREGVGEPRIPLSYQ